MAIASPELAILLAAVIVAGLVRGFSGFGTAMIFLPIAGRIYDPFTAILMLTVMDLFGPLPLLPRAIRDGRMGEVAWLLGAYALALPLGLTLLIWAEPEVFRWVLSAVILAVLVPLMAGFRHGLPFRPPTFLGFGAVSGVLGGFTGMPGPVVVLLYLASSLPAQVIRANTLVFLVGVDVIMVVALTVLDRVELQAVWIGLALFVPYTLAALAGQRLFDPARATLYRRVAYSIVGIAALQGLPIWDSLINA